MVKSAKGKLTSMKVMKAVSMKAAASTTQMKAMKAASSKTHMDVKKEATKANTNPGEGSSRLTKDNLKMPGGDGGEALNSKIEFFRQNKVPQSEFTKEEKRCLWARFHRAKQLNSEAASKWDAFHQQEGAAKI